MGRDRFADLPLVRSPAGSVARTGRRAVEAARGVRCGGERHAAGKRRWPGCRSVRGWPACCWKANGLASRRRWRWRRRCSASAIRLARGDDPPYHRPAAADSDSDVCDRVAALEDFAHPAGWIRPWGESIARRPSSCCTSAINCSANCGRRCGERSPHPLPLSRRRGDTPIPRGLARPCAEGCWPRFPIGSCGEAALAAVSGGWSADGACA